MTVLEGDGMDDEMITGKLMESVMTTRDYDSDANFFAYYFPITTPSAPACTITLLCSPFGLYLVLPTSSTLYSYHGLASTAWPMTHSDVGGCATSLFQDFLLPSI